MANIDYTMCLYQFTNKSSDRFNCVDGYISGTRSLITSGESNDVFGVTTNPSTNPSTGNFNVTFLRYFVGNDSASGRDFNITAGSTNLIYAFG